MAVPWDTMTTVGRIVRPHGLRGEVVVAPETDFGDDRFRVGAIVLLPPVDGGAPRQYSIRTSRADRGRWVIGFEGVDSIDGASALRDQDLRVPSDELKALGPGAFYVHDLVGCEIVTVAGGRVGTVARVEFGTGTPVLVATGSRGEVWVPLAESICRRVDVKAGRIVIDPPDGLLDLNAR